MSAPSAKLQAAVPDQSQHILGMVQHFDSFEMILLPEYLQADRARSDERRNPVLAEKRNVVIHHLAGRIGFTGELQRPAAANAALLVRPPDLFARTLKIRSIANRIRGVSRVIHPAK